MRNIELALQEHKQKVLDELKIAESQLLGVFLYGSQNYGLSAEDSDVDTIAIVLPNEYDLYFSHPLTKELHLENGEHCIVKDIREIFNEFKKQNVNFLEILVTDYKWLNPIYFEQWNFFTCLWTDYIVRYDVARAIKSICGQGKHTLRQALNKDILDGKKAANAFKMLSYLIKYLDKLPFKKCITAEGTDKQYIMDLKTGKKEISKEEAEALIKSFEEKEKIFEDFKSERDGRQIYIDKKLKETAFNFCKTSAILNPYNE